MDDRTHYYFDEDFYNTNSHRRRYGLSNLNLYREFRNSDYFVLNYSDRQLVESISQERKQIKLVNKYYGKFGSFIYRKLKKEKILNKVKYHGSKINLYIILYSLFAKNLYKEKYSKTNEKNLINLKNLKFFVKCLPSVKFIEKYFRKLTPINEAHLNDICTIYIVLELLNLYYEKFDFPLFKLINFGVYFYSNLPENIIELIQKKCIFKENYHMKKYPINKINSKENILNKYLELKVDKSRLFGNLNMEVYSHIYFTKV